MKTGIPFLVCFSILLLTITACEPKSKPLAGRYYTGLLFGKPYTIDQVGDSSDFQIQIDSIIHAFESSFDLNNPKSVLSRYNAYTRMDSAFCFYDTTKAFGIVYDLTRDFNSATFQYFDPTMAPLRREWIVANSYGLGEPNLDSIYAFVGFDGAKMDLNELYGENNLYRESQLRKANPKIEADFTSLATAVALDHIGDFFEQAGILQYRIVYGNDVITFGNAIDTMNIVSIHIAGDSGDQKIKMSGMAFSFKNDKDKLQMIDPTYGYPVENEMAYVAVVAPTLAEATVFSSAFMAMGFEKASDYYNKNKETRIESFMFYQDENILKNASTYGFDALLMTRDSVASE
jgi:thiamine biosynthesis lipoprotein